MVVLLLQLVSCIESEKVQLLKSVQETLNPNIDFNSVGQKPIV